MNGVIDGHIADALRIIDRALRHPVSTASNVTLERDFDRAKILAWSQEAEIVWSDLKEDERATVSGPARRSKKGQEIERWLSDSHAELFHRAATTLPSAYVEIAEEMAADLIACISAKVHVGAHTFFDLLWQAYAGGTWPCGWKGSYPGGSMIVFFPAALPRREIP